VRHLVVAVTGASGVRYALRLLEVVHAEGIDVTLAVSRGGARVLEIEEGLRVDPQAVDAAALVRLRKGRGASAVRTVALDDVAAGISSGTHPVDAMVVVPCSMGTLSRIAHGNSGNVIERAADVMMKEGRPLVLVPREAPYSRIHIENMLRAHDAGAAIVPASPGFYHRPRTVEDLVDQVVTKVLDRLGLRVEIIRRWKAPRPR
jgi:4-hydroxy-3-polyprenylbenzoate decarboxylase